MKLNLTKLKSEMNKRGEINELGADQSNENSKEAKSLLSNIK